jgi:hypothetical protein
MMSDSLQRGSGIRQAIELKWEMESQDQSRSNNQITSGWIKTDFQRL